MNRKKNVIVLLCDQLQKRVTDPDHICIMENLSRLREDSVSFTQAHAANAICSPSRASLMTGKLPHNHGMVDCAHTVPAFRADYDSSLDTLSRRLKAADYRTAYYGKWHVERTYDLGQYGFDEYETEMDLPVFHLTPVSKVVIRTEGYRDKTICGTFSEDQKSTEEHYIYSKAMDFMKKAGAEGQPFCTFISTYAPHDPYAVPEEIYKKYHDIPIELPRSFGEDMGDKPSVYRRLQSVWKELSREECKEILRCYYSYCTLIDLQIGRLVEFLKRERLYDDTLIVFTADHGDLMGAHGLFCKGVPAFEETYSIPLIMKLPGQEKAGFVCSAYANTYDLAPTILELLDCEPLQNPIDGTSLVSYLEGEDPKDSICFAEFEGQRYAYTQRIVWSRGWKYVFNTFDYDELYDLNRDPHETENLAALSEYEDKKKEMAALMWEWILKTGDDTLTDAQYVMLRFAPQGPNTQKSKASFAIFNKPF